MPEALATPDAEVTPEDRTMAILAHALQIVAWWIGPLIIFLMRRERRFPAFHALQALMLQVTIVVIQMVVGLACAAILFLSIAYGDPKAAPPLAFFLFIWLEVIPAAGRAPLGSAF